jgi:cell division protein FtsB
MLFRALLISALIILVLGTARGEQSIKKYFELKNSRDILKSSLDQIKAQNSQLQDEIYKIKNSPQYAEKILRDRYHIKDQDENIIFFAD